jgi:hypothetical protein
MTTPTVDTTTVDTARPTLIDAGIITEEEARRFRANPL